MPHLFNYTRKIALYINYKGNITSIYQGQALYLTIIISDFLCGYQN